MIRVLIADDHVVVREGLRTILEVADDIVLVGEAADGAEAVRLSGELAPQVLLMDLRMPNMDGMEAVHQVKAHVTGIFNKLGVSVKAEAVAVALRQGRLGSIESAPFRPKPRPLILDTCPL